MDGLNIIGPLTNNFLNKYAFIKLPKIKKNKIDNN